MHGVVFEISFALAFLVVKGGTKIRNVRLQDATDGHNIACKIDGIGAMNVKSELVRMA